MLAQGLHPDPGLSDFRIAQSAQRQAADVAALLLLLDSLIPTPLETVRQIATPTLVVIGDRDRRSDADRIAAELPAGSYVSVPGNHATAPSAPEFAAAIASFIAT